MADEDKDSRTPPIKHWQDSSGRLKKAGEHIIQKEYPDLKAAHILYTWRDPCAWEGDKPVGARARKLPTMWRDLIKADFQIEVCYSTWKTLTPEQRYRLLWHELKHCVLVRDEDGAQLYESVGRKKITILPRDIVIETFEEEVKRWGVHPIDIHSARLVAQRLALGKARYNTGRHGKTAERP